MSIEREVGTTKKNGECIGDRGAAGAVGGIAIWLLFVTLLFAFPDPQNGIGLLISPFFSGIVGMLVAVIVGGAVAIHRGQHFVIVLVFPASLVLLGLLYWFVSELIQASF